MSNRWDTAFSRLVSCPNDKTGAKLTAICNYAKTVGNQNCW